MQERDYRKRGIHMHEFNEFDEFYESLRPILAASVAEVLSDLGTVSRDDLVYEMVVTLNLVELYAAGAEDDKKYAPFILMSLKRLHALIELVFNLASINVRQLWIHILDAEQSMVCSKPAGTMAELLQAHQMLNKVYQCGIEEFTNIHAIRFMLKSFQQRLARTHKLTPEREYELHAILYAVWAADGRGEIDLDRETLSGYIAPLAKALGKRMSEAKLSELVAKLKGALSRNVN